MLFQYLDYTVALKSIGWRYSLPKNHEVKNLFYDKYQKWLEKMNLNFLIEIHLPFTLLLAGQQA